MTYIFTKMNVFLSFENTTFSFRIGLQSTRIHWIRWPKSQFFENGIFVFSCGRRKTDLSENDDVTVSVLVPDKNVSLPPSLFKRLIEYLMLTFSFRYNVKLFNSKYFLISRAFLHPVSKIEVLNASTEVHKQDRGGSKLDQCVKALGYTTFSTKQLFQWKNHSRPIRIKYIRF